MQLIGSCCCCCCCCDCFCCKISSHGSVLVAHSTPQGQPQDIQPHAADLAWLESLPASQTSHGHSISPGHLKLPGYTGNYPDFPTNPGQPFNQYDSSPSNPDFPAQHSNPGYPGQHSNYSASTGLSDPGDPAQPWEIGPLGPFTPPPAYSEEDETRSPFSSHEKP